MRFQEFLELIPKLKKTNVDGTLSHLKMMPPNRAELLKMAKEKYSTHREAAVLALLYPCKKDHINLALILRKTYKGVHSNQVGFPGGKYEDSDGSLEYTALRETEEEVGISRSKIEVISALTKVYIPPSNYMVYPYLGFCKYHLNFQIQESEVEKMIEIPLEFLLDDKAEIKSTQLTATNKILQVPAFHLGDYDVWGATAMILSELKDLCKNNL